MSTAKKSAYDIADPSLAEIGVSRIEWAAREMPVIGQIRERFEAQRPLSGISIGACLHVTTETANLILTLQAGGAEVSLCASNPLSTQDDVAAALVQNSGVSVFAIKGESEKQYYAHIASVLDQTPQITIDDGADLVATIHKSRPELLDSIIGGMEETTTGVIRLRSMERDGALKYPILAVNDAKTKHYFDNRYGTGQSTIDGVIRATNMLLAGKTVVVSGYGWCGRGIASRARGHGSHVVVTEIDPLTALEAVMDGFQVMPMETAAEIGDLFITVTGDINVLDRPAFQKMKTGAILANSGHFNHEINIDALAAIAEHRREIRPFVEEFRLPDGRLLYVLAEGRLINLSAAEGHPASVMDMSFANQALATEHLALEKPRPEPGVHSIPKDIDDTVARLKLEAMGVTIDRLTTDQEAYLNSWETGT